MPWRGPTMLARRRDVPEWLDDLAMDGATLVGNLRDIRRFNRLLRWDTLVAREAARLLGSGGTGSTTTILDVGCGSGDIALAVAGRLRRCGHAPRIVCADLHPPVLAEARRHIGGAVLCAYLCADGLRLPLPDRAVDLALCTATLHHFAPDTAVRLLGELARVTRGAILVGDLARGWFAYLGARAITAVALRNPATRHDGVASALRAYTPREVRALAREAGLVGASVRARPPGRLTLAWRASDTGEMREREYAR